jgi:hypothetical protein
MSEQPASKAPLRVSTPLTPGDRRLIAIVATLVPAADLPDWLRTWNAELWHIRRGQHPPVSRFFLADLSVGLTLDALWLRRECWRRRHRGTAALCLVSLASLCLVATLILKDLAGTDRHAWAAINALVVHSLFATPLVLFVGGATAWRYTAPGPSRNALASLSRTAFLAGKTVLVLALAALLSTDLCLPLQAHFRGMSDVLQQLCFVLLALLGLRWSFTDQQARCKHCLRALASPERVGRPTHNLLEWAGTEQVCILGHGALSSPEMVSSWANHSRWIDQATTWQPASGGS